MARELSVPGIGTTASSVPPEPGSSGLVSPSSSAGRAAGRPGGRSAGRPGSGRSVPSGRTAPSARAAAGITVRAAVLAGLWVTAVWVTPVWVTARSGVTCGGAALENGVGGTGPGWVVVAGLAVSGSAAGWSGPGIWNTRAAASRSVGIVTPSRTRRAGPLSGTRQPVQRMADRSARYRTPVRTLSAGHPDKVHVAASYQPQSSSHPAYPTYWVGLIKI